MSMVQAMMGETWDGVESLGSRANALVFFSHVFLEEIDFRTTENHQGTFLVIQCKSLACCQNPDLQWVNTLLVFF